MTKTVQEPRITAYPITGIPRAGANGYHQEDHPYAVGGEQLVVGVGIDDLTVRPGELGADQQGLQSSQQEEGKGGRCSRKGCRPLVVDRGDPVPRSGLGDRPAKTLEWR